RADSYRPSAFSQTNPRRLPMVSRPGRVRRLPLRLPPRPATLLRPSGGRRAGAHRSTRPQGGRTVVKALRNLAKRIPALRWLWRRIRRSALRERVKSVSAQNAQLGGTVQSLSAQNAQLHETAQYLAYEVSSIRTLLRHIIAENPHYRASIEQT